MQKSLSLFLCAVCTVNACLANNTVNRHPYTDDLFFEGKFSEALTAYEQLASQNPGNSEIACNIALVLQKMCRFSEAQKIYESVLEKEPENGRALRGISHVYLMLGNFTQGWDAYEYRWKNPPAFNAQLKNYVQQGLSLKGKHVLIRTEYGLGDTLQFIRYAQELKNRGARVSVACQPCLIPLLRLLPAIDTIFSQELECPHDFQVMLMSLPWIFATQEQSIPHTIPYLYADESLTQAMKSRVSSTTLNIGLCWETISNLTTPDPIVRYNAESRSLNIDQLRPLTDITGITFWCLQKITDPHERAKITALGIKLMEESFDSEHGAFMDTAALIKNLDLVISIDTAVAHLAGGLGTPLWLLLPHSPDWRWMLDRTDSPWYPTMRIFRQPNPHDWASVIATVKNELEAKVRNTNFSKGHYYLILDRPDIALSYFKKACTIDPDNPASLFTPSSYEPANILPMFGLSKAYIALGNYEKGWPLFEYRNSNAQTINQNYTHHRFDLRHAAGKTAIISLAPWGMGDIFFFIRYAQALKDLGMHVLVYNDVANLAPLQSLLSLAPGIDGFILPPFPADAEFIPLLSLPFVFKTSLSSVPTPIPYLKADDNLMNQWKARLTMDKKFKIGICWQTSQSEAENFPTTRRSIPVELFLKNLTSREGISIYSLQKGAGAAYLKTLSPDLQKLVFNLGPELDELHGAFMDTAAVMENLDLIITVDTSIAHLAGALGRPVWVLLPYTAEWRWMRKRSDTPWYPTMRLFRQQTVGDWENVWSCIMHELHNVIANKKYPLLP